MDKSKMDPLNLKAAQRRRDAMVDEASDGAPADTAPVAKVAVAVDTPPAEVPRPKKPSRMAELMKLASDKVGEYKKAWNEGSK